MLQTKAGRRVEELLAQAGVTIGLDPSCHIQVDNEDFIREVLAGGDIAIGDGYMDRHWWCNGNMVEIFDNIFRSNIEGHIRDNKWRDGLLFLSSLVSNPQSIVKSRRVSTEHYDLPPIIFEKMLGAHGDYSSLRWPQGTVTIEQAQHVKYVQLSRKLQIKEGERVLDTGCGRGGLARFLAEECGAEVVGLTISREWAEHAREHCRGFPVRIMQADYREMRLDKYKPFHKVVSVGMLEHVGGFRNLDIYMRFVFEALAPQGIFLCHWISGSGRLPPWIHKWIFSGGSLQPLWMVAKAAQRYFRAPEDYENFGWDYYLTLVAWYKNFIAHWDEIVEVCGEELIRLFGSLERFRRMWEFYLLVCAARFKARRISVGQLVYVRGGARGVYQASRP